MRRNQRFLVAPRSGSRVARWDLRGQNSALLPRGPPCASGRAPRAFHGGQLYQCRDDELEPAASAVLETVHGEGARVSAGHVALRDLQRVGMGGKHDALALTLGL